MENILKERWREGKCVSNAWLTIPNSWTAEIASQIGYDVVTIDAQHGLASDISSILPMLQAIKGTNSIPFVRIPSNDHAFIMRMLDAGVVGLICPMINSAEETEAFVSASKYPPRGNRSLGAIRASLIYGESYSREANDFTTTLAMIETPDALKNLREILSVKDLDGIYVGPWDLSLSLGFDKLADFEDPKFMVILQEILSLSKESNKIAGIHTTTAEHARKFADMGFQFVTMVTDTSVLKAGLKNALGVFSAVR